MVSPVDGIDTVEPAFDIPAKWISADKKVMADVAGYTLIDPVSVMITHLSEVIKQHCSELLSRQDVKTMVDNIKQTNPTLIDDLNRLEEFEKQIDDIYARMTDDNADKLYNEIDGIESKITSVLENNTKLWDRVYDEYDEQIAANDTDMDIVDGLERGADDYITKPFSLSVLRARVNTQLRKQVSVRSSGAVQIDHFRFDFAAMCFYAGDAKVELSKTEQKLLHLLVENRGQTVPRNVLVDRIWTDGAEYVDENALSVAVKRLRDKLGAQAYIKTVYGIGYSWVRADE